MTLTRKGIRPIYFFFIYEIKNRVVLSKEIIAEHLWGDNSDLADNLILSMCTSQTEEKN